MCKVGPGLRDPWHGLRGECATAAARDRRCRRAGRRRAAHRGGLWRHRCARPPTAIYALRTLRASGCCPRPPCGRGLARREGTTLGALAHGLPHVLLPQGADHFLNARGARQHGYGRALLLPDTTADCIGQAVHDAHNLRHDHPGQVADCELDRHLDVGARASVRPRPGCSGRRSSAAERQSTLLCSPRLL